MRHLLAAVVTAAALGAPAPALANCHRDICTFCAECDVLFHTACESVEVGAPTPLACD